jgi:hypothetical protein
MPEGGTHMSEVQVPSPDVAAQDDEATEELVELVPVAAEEE